MCLSNGTGEKAGKFKEMISTENSRGICLFSKLMVMIICGAISLIITVSGFYIGFQYFLKQNMFSINLYINIAVVVFIAQISLYLFHVFLSIRFGSGVSIGMGIFESMISGLFITGLGDGIWRYVPCSFAVRFSDGFFVKEAGTADVFNTLAGTGYWIKQCAAGFINCIIITFVGVIALKMWFDYFEFSNCE
ncbi:lantibiotic immunity ABC transporter MutG family permease subunit [Clostridium butyricum]